MPYSISISPEEKLSYWTLDGTVGSPDVLGAMAEMISHPDWRPEFNTIVFIAADADMSAFDFDEFLAAQRQLGSINRAARGDRTARVGIVSQNEGNQGILALWEALNETSDVLNIRYRLFPTEEGARAWVQGDGEAR